MAMEAPPWTTSSPECAISEGAGAVRRSPSEIFAGFFRGIRSDRLQREHQSDGWEWRTRVRKGPPTRSTPTSPPTVSRGSAGSGEQHSNFWQELNEIFDHDSRECADQKQALKGNPHLGTLQDQMHVPAASRRSPKSTVISNTTVPRAREIGAEKTNRESCRPFCPRVFPPARFA